MRSAAPRRRRASLVRSSCSPSSRSAGTTRRDCSLAASSVGVLLIEQFAHVALGLAETAYVLERGRIHYHGTAQRLKDEPQLLESAYLLRDVDPGGEALESLS